MPDPKVKKSLDYGKDINLPYQPKGISITEPKRLPERYPTGVPQGQHPPWANESALEKSIKYAGLARGSMIPSDLPYFEQYMHPEFDVLDRQTQRPIKRGGNLDEDEWFRAMPLAGTNNRYTNPGGLGRHVTSKGEDYNSIYDKWDFDTDFPLTMASPLGWGPDSVAKSVLKHLGKPFHVYERVEKPGPDDTNTDLDEYPIINPSHRGQDINLPASGIGPTFASSRKELTKVKKK